MKLLIMGAAIYAIVEIIKAKKSKKRQTQIDKLRREQNRQKAEQTRLSRECKARKAEAEKLAKEQERQAAQIAKHEEQIAKLELKVSQTEFVIANEKANLDHYAEKLWALDAQMKKLDTDIRYYNLANKVDAIVATKKEEEKIKDKIFSVEKKVREAEKRLAKAEFEHEQAKVKLSA